MSIFPVEIVRGNVVKDTYRLFFLLNPTKENTMAY